MLLLPSQFSGRFSELLSPETLDKTVHHFEWNCVTGDYKSLLSRLGVMGFGFSVIFDI